MTTILQDEMAQWALIVGVMLVAIALRMWVRHRNSASRRRSGCPGCQQCVRPEVCATRKKSAIEQ